MDANDVATSLVRGGGVYVAVSTDVRRSDGAGHDLAHDPLDQARDLGPRGERWCTPVQNVLTGERLFLRAGGLTPQEALACARHVLHPAPPALMLSPVDAIVLPGSGSMSSTYPIRRAYVDTLPKAQVMCEGTGLLFATSEVLAASRSAYDEVTPLAKAEELHWRNPLVRELACAIARTFSRLNDAGFVYCDVHLDRIRLLGKSEGSQTGRLRAMLDFTTLCFDEWELRTNDAGAFRSPGAGLYPVEFAEPAYVAGRQRTLDKASQDYGLAALLFFLLMGRYAYDGPLLMNASDDTLLAHYLKFRDYHRMPVFIFDEHDESNHLGTFDDDRVYLKRWKTLPGALCDMFRAALGQRNAMREQAPSSPTAQEWLHEFESIGWMLDSRGKWGMAS